MSYLKGLVCVFRNRVDLREGEKREEILQKLSSIFTCLRQCSNTIFEYDHHQIHRVVAN